MSRGAPGQSLSTQLLGNVFLSLIIAAVSFCYLFLGITYGDLLLEKRGYAQALSAAVEDFHFSQLRVWVERQRITPETVDSLDGWSRLNRIELAVYQGERVLYETGGWTGASLGRHELALWDGTEVQAALSYDQARTLKHWELGICAVLSFAIFCVCFTALIHSKLRYVKTLKEELDMMAGGQLERPVTVQGYDELGELAAGMDEMRRSFLAHLREEDQIRSANSQLVAAMSHDLRTPLTSLMAYLELLDRRKYSDEAQMRHLIRQSLTQTQAIKSMTDKLFEYFLVYATEWEQPDMETVDADGLIRQLWEEYAFALESEGFTVEIEARPLDGSLSANLPLLRRAFDNVYANLLKYADPAYPIRVGWRRREGELSHWVENGISPQRDKKESTNIGLKTCRRVLRLHSGSFDTVEENGRFRADMTLPLL